jgi:hypothetical protein
MDSNDVQEPNALGVIWFTVFGIKMDVIMQSQKELESMAVTV